MDERLVGFEKQICDLKSGELACIVDRGVVILLKCTVPHSPTELVQDVEIKEVRLMWPHLYFDSQRRPQTKLLYYLYPDCEFIVKDARATFVKHYVERGLEKELVEVAVKSFVGD